MIEREKESERGREREREGVCVVRTFLGAIGQSNLDIRTKRMFSTQSQIWIGVNDSTLIIPSQGEMMA